MKKVMCKICLDTSVFFPSVTMSQRLLTQHYLGKSGGFQLRTPTYFLKYCLYSNLAREDHGGWCSDDSSAAVAIQNINYVSYYHYVLQIAALIQRNHEANITIFRICIVYCYVWLRVFVWTASSTRGTSIAVAMGLPKTRGSMSSLHI